MKGLTSLFLGIFATFAFSWVGLVLIPNWQIGHLSPQSDEEGTDIYPMPPSGMVERGRHVFAANGCVYCHSTQLRPDYVSSDLDRVRDLGQHAKWGQRRSAPRDYIFDRPVLLGKERMGPDLSNMGKAAPAEDENAAPSASPSPVASSAAPGASPAPAVAAASPASTASPSPAPAPPTGGPPPYSTAWHHLHLYAPRTVSGDSNMPAYRFLYEERRATGARSADALDLTGDAAPAKDSEIVPTYEAKCLVAYLMSLDQSHPLFEVKSAGAAPAPASSPAVAPAPAAPGAAPASAPKPSPAK
ncbi:MAG: cbb3-type cytochrome c oxidase subunit II [Verrucomicrobiota bacterium]